MLIANSFAFAQSESDKLQAEEYFVEAITIMDEGQYEESIALLRKAKKLNPDESDYTYEIAYAYCIQKKYKEAIKEIKTIISNEDTNDQYYQLLGNCYDYIGKSEKALTTYKQGLEKFPNSGRLYLEQGVVEYTRENYNEAINYWETGVETEPTYSSNYYWLGKIFSYTDERIWSVLYAEMFINLERNTARTKEMSKILYEAYKESVYISSDTSEGVDFSKVMILDETEGFTIPFQMSYGMVMSMSLPILSIKKDHNISIGLLNNLRQSFISNWYEMEFDKDYSNLLFDFQRQLKAMGYIEAYNYWLMMTGDEDEFGIWYETNESQFNDFVDWFNENPITVNKENYFLRLNY